MLSRPKRRQKEQHATRNSFESNSSHDHRNVTPQYLSPSMIYSAPTVDTLGDDTASIRPYATPRPVLKTAATSTVAATPTKITTFTSISDSLSSSMWMTQKILAPRRRRRLPPQPKSENEIQKREDAMNVCIRIVPVAERSAFDLQSAPLMSELVKNRRQLKKTSPSPLHLQLIHKLQSIHHIRQLAFSPSVGSSSDVLYQGESEKHWRERRSNSTFASYPSDGRYKSIDPVRATLSRLPATPPLLSNKRHRLPMRADVGFPNPSPEEIQQKQREIHQETEWEEASPRLIVLITSDDLGMAAVDPTNQNDCLLKFAGPEVRAAKWQNQQHFSKNRDSSKEVPPSTANRYSVLAPPLDSTYSSTVGWRPRPFHDRPPGLRYTLVSPVTVEFGIGNIEPLVCSLCLYRLGTGKVVGKSSEEFYFPAGDWRDKLQIDALKGNVSLTEQWLKRKHKALFALDPLVVPTQELYVVLQIYAVTHLELATAYVMGKSTGEPLKHVEPPKDRKSWRKRLKLQYHKGKATPEAHIQRASYRASAVFDNYGTRFLSPLCFGVTQLQYSDVEEYSWPAGKCHNDITMYTYPPKPESQEAFVQRLWQLVAPSAAVCNVGSSIVASFTDDSLSTTASTSSIPTDASTQSHRRKGLGRFISPKKAPKKDLLDYPTTSTGQKKIEMTPTVHAKVSLFISDLQSDFLDSMLQCPQELSDSEATMADLQESGDKQVLPKLLVDVSGSCAIMMDPTKAEGINDSNKRSNLVRLPPTPKGYMDVADFREIWFLPPMPPKQYHVDAPPSYRSLVNILYLYPRLLRHSGAMDNKSSLRRGSKQQNLMCYTVRVCLIERSSQAKSEDEIIEGHPTTSKNFHNPVPWAGPSLIKSVYTKISGDVKVEDLKAGIPLNDEFKLRLPAVLDGNQFLKFTLCGIEFSDDLDDSVSTEQPSTDESCGLLARDIAEATIPLSTHSTRDPVSGNKVTTIIPNGCHRLKLGDFQLQVETRLLSSIHVNDPSLATALREFPFVNKEEAEISEAELALATSNKSAQEKNMFSSLFATAEPTALVGHFPALFFMHLTNLVNAAESSKATNERFLIDCMSSLLEICSRMREAIIASGASGRDRLGAFIKDIVDTCDETYFHSSQQPEAADDDDTQSDELSESVEQPPSGEELKEDEFDGGAIRKRRKDNFRSEIDTRISRTFSAMESPHANFLRTPYGATKTDRMRLEAELDANAGRLTHLVDDDETVVTFATGYSGEARMVEAREAFERSKTPKSKDLPTVNSLEDRDIASAPSNDFNYKTISEMGLAKRVRSAAKVMLAPCVPPNFFNASPRNNSSWQGEKTTLDEGGPPVSNEESPEDIDRIIAISGSDAENCSESVTDRSDEVLGQMGVALRFPWNCPLLRFSVEFEPLQPDGNIRIAQTDYLYESILLIWLRSIKDHTAGQDFLQNSILMSTTSPDNDDFFCGLLENFQNNIDLLLPLCLKSIGIRFGHAMKTSHSPITRVIVDKRHMALFESLFEIVPLFLVREAMTGLKSGGKDKDDCLLDVLSKSEPVIDFLIGLYAMLHPAQTSVLTRKLFQSLRRVETEGLEVEANDARFEWTPKSLQRIKCSRQLRLRVVEKLAVLPNFVALNYPMRFPSQKLPTRTNKQTWTNQHADTMKDKPFRSEDLLKDSEYSSPPSGWLAEILTRESLSISALSCEAVVAEAMAHIEENEPKSTLALKTALKTRPTISLTREDLLMFQSIAIHGITCVHELLLRRHAMDRRYQKETTRGRVASLFAIPIFETSLASVRWLSRMESTHRVRSLWLLCFTYVLQEAPENLLREAVSSYSKSREVQIHRFIRLLRLSSSTFQSFIDQQRYCMFPSEIDSAISPWLLQESFNTICATTIIVVEECASPTSTSLLDQKKMIQGILDLLLHVLTTPQSSVTHLRAVGGAIQALERFGAAMFLEITDGSLQHWIRVMAGLMNSIALSVRSIAVDFVVSLFGSSFDMYGSIDELALIFATVLPEVAGREIGLCSVSGHIKSLDDAEKAIWPLRRSFADLEDANPLDDDRVDPQLSPMLSLFCRACQAMLDGVLIEMRLHGKNFNVVGMKLQVNSLDMYTFDADEESLFEAANFFVPENAPMQRIRWLMTLKSLHKAKGQWMEAAECLIMCARTIADSIPHMKNVWRPSRFQLWSDSRRSLWLSTVGEDLGFPERGNEQVMSFADNFLEPVMFNGSFSNRIESGTQKQPSFTDMCKLLTDTVKEAITMYDEEGGLEGLAYSRLESLLMILMDVLESQVNNGAGISRAKTGGMTNHRQNVEDGASLRKVIASISGAMTKLAESMPLLAERVPSSRTPRTSSENRHHCFVRVVISGAKPTRFKESTTLPTFLEWGTPCICRVPKDVVDKALSTVGPASDHFEEVVCSLVGKPIHAALLRDGILSSSIIFRLGNQSPSENDKRDGVIVDIGFVQLNFMDGPGSVDRRRITSPLHRHDDLVGSSNFDGRNLLSKQFIYRKPPGSSAVISSTFVEVTVANPFPCPLSRQRSLLTSEYVSNK